MLLLFICSTFQFHFELVWWRARYSPQTVITPHRDSTTQFTAIGQFALIWFICVKIKQTSHHFSECPDSQFPGTHTICNTFYWTVDRWKPFAYLREVACCCSSLSRHNRCSHTQKQEGLLICAALRDSCSCWSCQSFFCPLTVVKSFVLVRLEFHCITCHVT